MKKLSRLRQCNRKKRGESGGLGESIESKDRERLEAELKKLGEEAKRVTQVTQVTQLYRKYPQKILLRDISVEILGPETSSDDLKGMGRRLSNLFRDRLGFIVKVEGKNKRWVYLPAMHAAKLLEIDLLFPYSRVTRVTRVTQQKIEASEPRLKIRFLRGIPPFQRVEEGTVVTYDIYI